MAQLPRYSPFTAGCGGIQKGVSVNRIAELQLNNLPKFPSPVGTLACEVDPEAWYAPIVRGALPANGKRRLTPEQEDCFACPVREECLQFALENDEGYGVWGGLTPYERDQLKKGKAA